MSKNVCEVLLEIIADAGVEFIFTIPGGAINEMVEALRKQDKIKLIHVRHEEAGAFAASAIAKLTGKLTVCMGTSGPGAIHLLNGLYDAKHDHVPVLAISGQVDTEYKGLEAHQEVAFEQLFDGVAVYNQTLVHAGQMPRIAEEAVRMALYHKGVAHISLPRNIAGQSVPNADARTHSLYEKPLQIPVGYDLDKAATLLNEHEKITILAGQGARDARMQLHELAKKLNAPIIKALNGKDILPDDDAYSVGGLGLLGTRPAVKAMENCDLLIMVGTSFPYYEYYPEDNIPAIQIDLDGTQIGKRFPVQVGLVGDSRSTLEALLPLIHQKKDDSFLKDRQSEMSVWRKQMSDNANRTDMPIHPQLVAAAIDKVAADNAIYCVDTGNVTVWATRQLRIRGTQRFTLSGGLASMGYGLPAAIGAKLTFPDRQVFAIVGDGGFTMLIGDLATAVHYKLPIVIVVFNNHKLGMIQLEQEVMGYPEYATHMHNPDFAATAIAFGAQGERITRPEDVEPALRRAMAANGSYVLDMEVKPSELAMPPRIEAKQAIGMAKAKIREVLFGEGDNIILTEAQ